MLEAQLKGIRDRIDARLLELGPVNSSSAHNNVSWDLTERLLAVEARLQAEYAALVETTQMRQLQPPEATVDPRLIASNPTTYDAGDAGSYASANCSNRHLNVPGSNQSPISALPQGPNLNIGWNIDTNALVPDESWNWQSYAQLGLRDQTCGANNEVAAHGLPNADFGTTPMHVDFSPNNFDHMCLPSAPNPDVQVESSLTIDGHQTSLSDTGSVQLFAETGCAAFLPLSVHQADQTQVTQFLITSIPQLPQTEDSSSSTHEDLPTNVGALYTKSRPGSSSTRNRKRLRQNEPHSQISLLGSSSQPPMEAVKLKSEKTRQGMGCFSIKLPSNGLEVINERTPREQKSVRDIGACLQCQWRHTAVGFISTLRT